MWWVAQTEQRTELLPERSSTLGSCSQVLGRWSRWSWVTSAAMQALAQTVVVKKELSSKAKLSIYRFGPNLTIICDLDCWVAIARSGIRILVVKQGFFLESGWCGALDGEDNVTRAAAHRHSGCFDIQNATPWRCSRNVPLDEGPGLTEGIAYPTWPGDTLGRRPGTP